MTQRARRAGTGALLGIILLVLVNLATFHIGAVERLDASVFNGFGGLRLHPHVGGLAQRIADLCDPRPYVFLCVLPLAIALVRRRWAVAVAALGILLAANLTTELLKPALGQHRPVSLIQGAAPSAGSWPSGHATAAMSLALVLVLVVAPRWRVRAAALGAVFALGVTYSFLTLGWHYPSDAVAGFLVATTWTLAGIAGLSLWQARRAVRPAATERADARHELTIVGGGLLGAGTLAALLALGRLAVIVPYARTHEKLIVAIVCFALLAGGLASGVVLSLRRSRGGV